MTRKTGSIILTITFLGAVILLVNIIIRIAGNGSVTASVFKVLLLPVNIIGGVALAWAIDHDFEEADWDLDEGEE